MNWVLVVGGLIPLWTVLMIVFMNRGATQRRPPRRAAPEYRDEYDYDYETAPQEKPPRTGLLKKINLGFLSGVRGRLPGGRRAEAADEYEEPPEGFDEADDIEPRPTRARVEIGVDFSAERRLWGKTLLIFTGAGFVNGLYMVLDHVFTVYRKSLGMKLPLAAEFKTLCNLTLVVFGVSVLLAALKTGLRLMKS